MSAEERGGFGHETENENLKPGAPARPSTEPDGAEGSTATDKTMTDPSTGAPTGGTPSKGG